MEAAWRAMRSLPAPGAHYLLPFGARSRFLFKMDFAEAEYIARAAQRREGPLQLPRDRLGDEAAGWSNLEPELGRLMEATPPWVEDMLKR